MVMGPTHAMSGAAAWLAAAALGGGALAAAMGESPAVIALGTAVCAGAALAPDIDSHSSTVVRSFGIFGKLAHHVADGLSVAVYAATSSRYDKPRENGHRTLFHTTAMAILVAVLVSLGSSLPGEVTIAGKVFALGQLFSLVIMGLFLHLGLAGIFEKQVKSARKKYGPYLLMAASAGLTALTAMALPENEKYSWLGLAVGIGWFMHLLGDMITKMGVPMAWPVKIRGKRWYDVTLPSFMRISADGTGNTVLLFLCTCVSILMILLLIPATNGFITGLF